MAWLIDGAKEGFCSYLTMNRQPEQPRHPKTRALAFLRLFRAVNLPTVPGDVFVGAAALLVGVAAAGGRTTAVAESLVPVWWAAAAGVFLYMFGLVDNDIAGAKTDEGRPIPDGEISLGAARVARFLCLAAAAGAGVAGALPCFWGFAAFALALCCVVYNRTKWSALMGLCRGLNVLCGALALVVGNWRGVPGEGRLCLLAPAVAWTLYIWGVTKYSEGEGDDPAKKRRVGMLIGGIVYLQLIALVVCAILRPDVAPLRALLVAGAVMLALLRVMKTALPRVSAS